MERVIPMISANVPKTPEPRVAEFDATKTATGLLPLTAAENELRIRELSIETARHQTVVNGFPTFGRLSTSFRSRHEQRSRGSR